MKITKFTHSCLLVEFENNSYLIDPGKFSAGAELLDGIDELDYLLITHLHSDHLHLPIIEKLLTRFPEMQIVTNTSAAEELLSGGIQAITKAPDGVEMIELEHEPPSIDMPMNVGFKFGDKFIHCGDSNRLETYCEVAAMPVVGMWTHGVKFAQAIAKIKPTKALPLHDWYLHEEGRDWYFEHTRDLLEEDGIEMLTLKPGESVEL